MVMYRRAVLDSLGGFNPSLTTLLIMISTSHCAGLSGSLSCNVVAEYRVHEEYKLQLRSDVEIHNEGLPNPWKYVKGINGTRRRTERGPELGKNVRKEVWTK